MARKSKQLSLIPDQTQNRLKSFGGELNKGKRKTARPISIKKSMHVVIKSSKAVGRLSFLNHQRQLDQSLRIISKKWGVVVRKTAWVRNHVHLILQIGSRSQYQGWVREMTSAMVHVLKTRIQDHSDLLHQLTRFFDHRPFTRVIEWGRDLENAIDYLALNQMEVVGLRPAKKLKCSKLPSKVLSS